MIQLHFIASTCTRATNRTLQQEMIQLHDVASTCTRATSWTSQQQEMIQLHYIAFTCTVECTSQELKIFAF